MITKVVIKLALMIIKVWMVIIEVLNGVKTFSILSLTFPDAPEPMDDDDFLLAQPSRLEN